jgi:hypothetical protein
MLVGLTVQAARAELPDLFAQMIPVVPGGSMGPIDVCRSGTTDRETVDGDLGCPQIEEVRNGLMIMHGRAARERVAENDRVLGAAVEDVAESSIIVQMDRPVLARVLKIDASRNFRLSEDGILLIALVRPLAEHEARTRTARRSCRAQSKSSKARSAVASEPISNSAFFSTWFDAPYRSLRRELPSTDFARLRRSLPRRGGSGKPWLQQSQRSTDAGVSQPSRPRRHAHARETGPRQRLP